MKIAVFENEINVFKTSFDAMNLIYFNKSLSFDFFESSQKIGDLNKLTEYDVVIIDIDLSIKSKLDGYQILEYLKNNAIKVKKTIVLTGHLKVKERLEEMGMSEIPVVKKHIQIQELANAIKK